MSSLALKFLLLGALRVLTRTFLIVIGQCLFLAGSAIATFSPEKIEGTPTKGPNCYYTALTVNQLVDLPALTVSDSQAALLFLNPAICSPTKTPQKGDIGIEFFSGIFNHVYTYLGPSLRFEKAGPQEDQRFTFVQTPSLADLFVRCIPMNSWINKSIRTLKPDLQQIYKMISKLESTVDVRVRDLTPKQKNQVIGENRTLIQGWKSKLAQALSKALLLHRERAPIPGMIGEDYFEFARRRPDLVSKPEIFALMWIIEKIRALLDSTGAATLENGPTNTSALRN